MLWCYLDWPCVVHVGVSGGHSYVICLFPGGFHCALLSAPPGSPEWLTVAAGFHSRGDLDSISRGIGGGLEVVKAEIAAMAAGALHLRLDPAAAWLLGGHD